MPDSNLDVLTLFAARLQPAMVIGLAAGALSWLLGLARITGAVATIAVVSLGFLAAGTPFAAMLALGLLGAGAAARLASRVAAAPGAPSKLSARAAGAIATVALICSLAALGSPRAGGWLVSMSGALTAALTTWIGLVVSASSTGHRYLLHTLRPVSAPSRGLTAAGFLVGVGAALAIAVVAFAQHVLGPGDPALVLLAAIAATAVATAMSLGPTDALSRRAVLASVLGAGIAPALTMLLS